MDHDTITKTGSSAILPVNITKSGVDARSTAIETKTYSKFINHVSKYGRRNAGQDYKRRH